MRKFALLAALLASISSASAQETSVPVRHKGCRIITADHNDGVNPHTIKLIYVELPIMQGDRRIAVVVSFVRELGKGSEYVIMKNDRMFDWESDRYTNCTVKTTLTRYQIASLPKYDFK